MRVGLLHPGQMGSSIGDALVESGHEVGWCSAGRGAASRARASKFQDLDELPRLSEWAEVIVSVCPPEFAKTLAHEVSHIGYPGLYVDANAVAPQTAWDIAALFEGRYVDGGIIGPPARQAESTRLYLSGTAAQAVAGLFSEGFVEAIVVDDQISSASALKMAYAAYTKGSSALLLAVNALAKSAGVLEPLQAEWARSQPALPGRSETIAKGVGPKAWRFAGEMAEIAETFAEHDLPHGFHRAAEQFYQVLAELKDRDDVVLEDILKLLVPKSD